MTSLKLCKCSQILYASLNAASAPNITKNNHYRLNLLHTLIYTVLLAEDLRSSFPPLGLHKEISDSPYIRIPLINIRNKKDRTLDAPSILIFFCNTGNKGMNISTGWMKLVHVANNQAVAHEGLIGRYFPRALGFSQTNLQTPPPPPTKKKKKQEQKGAISVGTILDFLPHPNLHPPTTEAPQRTKNNKIMIPLISFPHKVNNIRIEKPISIPP